MMTTRWALMLRFMLFVVERLDEGQWFTNDALREDLVAAIKKEQETNDDAR